MVCHKIPNNRRIVTQFCAILERNVKTTLHGDMR